MKALRKMFGSVGCALVLAFSGVPAWADHHADASAGASQTSTNKAPYVRPDVQAYLNNLKANPYPEFTRELLAMIRKMPPAMMKSRGDLPVGELATIKDVIMQGPGGEIRMRLYDPRVEREAGPVVVFYHGGAYILGSIESHEGLTAEMARRLDLPVISVEYRLAPENPWPAAVDDGEASARWIAENGDIFGRIFTGLIISGDSAGGNLTLVTTHALMDKPGALPVIMQLPIYPATDRTKKYPSAKKFSQGFGLDSLDDNKHFYAADPQSIRASPLLADLTGLPPTVLVTAALDPLRDEGRAYAAKLVAAGVPTIYFEVKGNIHGFAIYRKAIPSAQEDTVAFLALAKAMLDEVVKSMSYEK